MLSGLVVGTTFDQVVGLQSPIHNIAPVLGLLNRRWSTLGRRFLLDQSSMINWISRFSGTLSQLLPKPILVLLDKYGLIGRAFQKFSILKFHQSLRLLLEFKSGLRLFHLCLTLIHFLAGRLVLEVEVCTPSQFPLGSSVLGVVCRAL